MRGATAPTLRDRPGAAWAGLAGVYLLLVLWAPVPALDTWLGVLLLGGLAALGFEAFRRMAVGELEKPPPRARRAGRLTPSAAAVCHPGEPST